MSNNTAKDNKVTTSGIDWGQSIYCPHRLPCGLCERTNNPCPYFNTNWTVGWTNFNRGE